MSGQNTLVAIADFGGRDTLQTVKDCFSDDIFTVRTFSTHIGDYLYPNSVGETLPFKHRELFASEVYNYDYFLFTENDIFYPQSVLKILYRHFHTFGPRYPLGVIRHEDDQLIDFGAVLKGSKIEKRDLERWMFVPTNKHQASYMLTSRQLEIAIDSGNYLIEPSPRGGYGMLETGASNVYYECGLHKAYPDRNFQNLLVRHMDLKWKFLQPRYTLDNLKSDLQ